MVMVGLGMQILSNVFPVTQPGTREKQTKGQEEEEKVNFFREFDEMLVKKQTKMANMMIEKDDLTSEIATAAAENKVMDRMISELE